jgi:hypothetical protein
MNPLALGSAAELLGDQSRIFTEVYKLYGFEENQALSEYVDFFLHEPVAWFEGLPGSLKSKASFAKPKTAFSKLIKQPEVISSLGEESCSHIHEVLWDTYKKEAGRIVAARSGDSLVHVDEPHEAIEAIEAINAIEAIEAIETKEPAARRSRKQKATVVNTMDTGIQTMTYETKYRVVDRALRAMLSDVTASNEAMLVFLDALKEA